MGPLRHVGSTGHASRIQNLRSVAVIGTQSPQHIMHHASRVVDDRSDRIVRGKHTPLGGSVALNVLRVSPVGLPIRASTSQTTASSIPSPVHYDGVKRVKHTVRRQSGFLTSMSISIVSPTTKNENARVSGQTTGDRSHFPHTRRPVNSLFIPVDQDVVSPQGHRGIQ